jgi:predicted MFS family arabinose efflux permease
VAAALAAVNGIAALFLLPESRSAEEAKRSGGQTATLAGWFATMTRSPISLLMIVYFLAISSFSGMTAVLALFLEDRFAADPQFVGLLFTLAGGATVVVRGIVLGRLVRRIGERRVARVGALALFASLAVLPVLPGPSWAAGAVVLWALGAGTLFPTLATLVSFAADRDSQGAVLGGSQVVGGLGRVTGPLWYGLLFQSVHVNSPFIVGAVLVGVSWVLAGRIPESLRPRRGETASAELGAIETRSVSPE